MHKFELHIDITGAVLAAELSLIHLLEQQIQQTPNTPTLSKAELKSAIDKGALWLTRRKRTNRLRRLKTSLQLHDQVHFYYNAEVLAQPTPEAKLIADFHDYSVWFKPYGMLSQGSKWSEHCTITRFAQQYFNHDRACFIVHRLDKAATGLIMVAHSKTATQKLTAMFEAHDFEKHYQIIVAGDFSTQSSPLVINTPIDDKESLSIFNFNQFNSARNSSLIDVKIATGRKHQIRKHAASIGFPVIGDRLHGDKTINEQQFNGLDLQLCAVKLAFICPISQQTRELILPDQLRPNLSNM